MSTEATIRTWMDTAVEAIRRAETAEAALAATQEENRSLKAALILMPMAARLAELPDFMAALSEWGCTDPNEQAASIADFLNSLVGLREYLESTQPTPDHGAAG